ncbi:hypothetical protein ACA910_021204 [Epithemia clementina (nom. ined.)]
MSESLAQIQSLWNSYINELNDHTNGVALVLRQEREAVLELNQMEIGFLMNLFRADQKREASIPKIQLFHVSFANEKAVDHFIRFLDLVHVENLHIFLCHDDINIATTWLLDRLWQIPSLKYLVFQFKVMPLDALQFDRLNVSIMLRHPKSKIQHLAFKRVPWNPFLSFGLKHHPIGLDTLILQECLLNDLLFGRLVDILLVQNVKIKNNLRILDIAGNKRIGKNSLPNLARLLEQCQALQDLNISSCGFFGGGVRSDHEPFQRVLKTIQSNCPTLQRLDMSSCGLDKQDAAGALFQMLQVNTTLRHLTINGFNAAPFLIESLPKMQGITSLSARLTGAATFHSSFLVALHRNTTLVNLVVLPRRDTFADAAVACILQRNRNLQRLSNILERRHDRDKRDHHQQQRQEQQDGKGINPTSWPLYVEALMMPKTGEVSKDVDLNTGGVDMSAVYGFLLATSGEFVTWLD